MSGQQIEDLGDFLLHTELHDNWNGLSPSYTNALQQERTQAPQSPNTATGDTSDHATSPPLTSYTEMLKDSALGVGEGLEAPSKSSTTNYQSVYSPEPDPATKRQNAMQRVNFSQGQQQMEIPGPSTTPAGAKPHIRHVAIKPVVPKLPGVQCQSIWKNLGNLNLGCQAMSSTFRPLIWSSDDDDITSFTDTSTAKQAGSAINVASEEDRGFRKKSREKMRRQEVNVKFEVLVDMLGFNNRVRKQVVLLETVSTIKSLKRECNQLRRDRDRLQQELDRLATHVQYAQVGLGAPIYGAAMSPVLNRESHE